MVDDQKRFWKVEASDCECADIIGIVSDPESAIRQINEVFGTDAADWDDADKPDGEWHIRVSNLYTIKLSSISLDEPLDLEMLKERVELDREWESRYPKKNGGF
jgi:hypothetical protein